MPSILSVGIDIGTSTTQVIFSQITMDNTAGYFSAPDISIVDKKIIYKSAVHFTPLQTETLIDGEGVRRIVAEEYQKAGYRPEDVDTGAVIITGESARKENAFVVLEKLSNFAGDFVVSTAGADLESIIAGKGSGAYQYSIDHECLVVNLDIGGGTTNIVQFYAGEIIGKSCFDIGGRLIKLQEDYTVLSISPAAQMVAETLGIPIVIGKKTTDADLKRITEKMAGLLAQALGLEQESNLLAQIHTKQSSWLTKGYPIAKICFSGGVADCIYHFHDREKLKFGDIGIYLGEAIRQSVLGNEKWKMEASETIRATVVGAGMYTTNLSGSTIYYEEGIFPVKSVPALKLSDEEEQFCAGGNQGALEKKVRWFLEQSDSEQMILAIRGLQDPGYQELKELASCIWNGVDCALPENIPMIVVVEQDIAKALGYTMRQVATGRRKIAVIDNIKIEVNDFVDIGCPMMDGMVVPVIVKTLLFG